MVSGREIRIVVGLDSDGYELKRNSDDGLSLMCNNAVYLISGSHVPTRETDACQGSGPMQNAFLHDTRAGRRFGNNSPHDSRFVL
jgi:hypothetical protein